MTPPAGSKFRRFYDAVAVSRGDDGDYLIMLDERPLKTPASARVLLPNPASAEAVASEWARQTQTIELAAMPLTQLTFAAVDRGVALGASLGREVARYAASDLLCYPAEMPGSLVALQAARWRPWLAWARDALGVDLLESRGIVPRAQSEQALVRVDELARAQGPYALVALVRACGLFGSAVLALALALGELSGEAAHDLARLDEAWQETHWGVDEEAAVRTGARRAEAFDLERWFLALGSARR